MANTQIKLRQLIQDGATTKQVIAWDGSNWAPSAVAGGIYSGSGTIASGAVATVLTNSSFSIKYNATATALSIVENTGVLNLYDGTTTARVLLDDLKARMSYGELNLTIDSARATLNTDLKLTSGYLSLDSTVTPSAITADTNDYNPTSLETSSILRISATGAFAITGLSSSHIAAAESGRLLVITNVGSDTINLHNESNSSAAANRFSFGSNVLLEPNKSITLYYDNTSDRWRPTSILHQGGGGGDGIYGGSGTIASAAVATVGSSSTFTIDYSNGNDAFKVTDASGIFMYAPAGAGNVGVDTLAAAMTFGGNNLIVDSTGTSTTGQFKISSGTVKLASILTPAQITANQNNYNPSGLSTAAVLRLSTDAARDVTGITAPATDSAGHTLVIHNTGSNNIVLKNEDANSTAANRFTLSADITIAANQSHTLIYDATSTRWRSLVTSTGGSSVTNLTFSGASSPVTINSSSGTGVTFTAGTGISLSATSDNITITNSSPAISDHNALSNLTTGDVHTQYAFLNGRSSGQTLKGGTGVTDVLTLVGTSGNGTATSAAIRFNVGNNGGTTAATILNNGKIGIGGTPDTSALLDITTTTLGFGLPVMTSTQRDAISAPKEGLLVFNSTDDTISVRANGAWTNISSTPTGFPTLSFNAQSGTSYTLVLADAGKMIRASNAASIIITVPTNATQAFATGTIIYIEQTGAGVVTLAPAGGVTILTTARSTPSQYSAIHLYKIDTDTWNVIGGTV
jgi:hypothetical protein